MIDQAIEVAAKAHNGQFRKGSNIPYITHPYAVGMMLLRAGCCDDVIAAGILHDTLEDTALTLQEIQSCFGEAVAGIVVGCSEPDRSLPWEKRKQHTLEYLRTAPMEIRWVVCADKLHNLRAMIMDFQQVGDQVWNKFRRGRQKQEWYYRGLVESLWINLSNLPDGSLFHQLSEEVNRLFGNK